MRARFLVPLFSIAAATMAQAQMPQKDAVNAKDHPLLSRFEGSKLVGSGVKEFDEVMLPAGKRKASVNGAPAFENRLTLEGRHTRLAYNYPKDRSSLEVMRNYQAALDKAGLKTLFSCVKQECGENFGEYWRDARVGNQFIKGGEAHTSPFNYGRNDIRYVLAKGTRPDGSLVHVAVLVVEPVQDKNGGVSVEIVEAKGMETGKVKATLSAADMASGIAADGKVAVYGIYFDTDKADVKPDSKPALAEMARLLQQDAKLKVYIVGHTDNQGAPARNAELSQKRADAVAGALAADYKVDAKRLAAKGVASYSPVASNDTDAGREKNRRVELVKQ